MRPPGEENGAEFPVYNSATYEVGYTWNVLRHLHHLMRTTECDVIDFAEYGAEGFAYQLARAAWNWAPMLVQLHAPLAMLAEYLNWPSKDSDFYRVGTFMEGVSIEKADGLIACSANIADFTSAFYGIARERIDVVHCGVGAETFQTGGEKDRVGDCPMGLFVGNSAKNNLQFVEPSALVDFRGYFPATRNEPHGSPYGAVCRGQDLPEK
jgi:hypothetical protein